MHFSGHVIPEIWSYPYEEYVWALINNDIFPGEDLCFHVLYANRKPSVESSKDAFKIVCMLVITQQWWVSLNYIGSSYLSLVGCKSTKIATTSDTIKNTTKNCCLQVFISTVDKNKFFEWSFLPSFCFYLKIEGQEGGEDRGKVERKRNTKMFFSLIYSIKAKHLFKLEIFLIFRWHKAKIIKVDNYFS